MALKEFYLKAKDGLKIFCYETEVKKPIGIVQIIHGMCEHKKRYVPFMEYLTSNGYICIMSDNRGHGKTISGEYPLGDTGTPEMMVSDQVIVTNYIKDKYPGLKLFIFGHSMGTLITRAYMMNHDNLVDGIILSGAPCPNPMAWLATGIAKMCNWGLGYTRSSKLLFFFVNNFSSKNDLSWLSYSEENIEKYSKDPLCGFYFKNRGYLTLFKMVGYLTKKKRYHVTKPNLPIYLLSGKDDRTTGGEKGVLNTVTALNNNGFNNVKHLEFDHMKHEILNEDKHMDVYEESLRFLGENL